MLLRERDDEGPRCRKWDGREHKPAERLFQQCQCCSMSSRFGWDEDHANRSNDELDRHRYEVCVSSRSNTTVKAAR